MSVATCDSRGRGATAASETLGAMAYTVVFVCSGNICRSPVAEKVFRARLSEAGLSGDVRVASVGLGPWHVGEPMDRRAAATLSERGYDDVDHSARQIDDETAAADLLVAATADHVDGLLSGGVDPGRVALLRSFDPDAPPDADVPDPYYGGPSGFDEVLEMVEAAMPGLLTRVRAAL